ncbi:MAG: hypothetical protein WDA41_10865, partial [Candidatus Neomarinimicrobiota bacterium]
MKKLLLCITIILCVCTYGWTAGVPFTGSIDSEDVDHGSNSVKAKLDAIDSFLEGIDSGTISDIDNLPGDTVDDNKIDSSLINNAAADGSTKGVCTFSAS